MSLETSLLKHSKTVRVLLIGSWHCASLMVIGILNIYFKADRSLFYSKIYQDIPRYTSSSFPVRNMFTRPFHSHFNPSLLLKVHLSKDTDHIIWWLYVPSFSLSALFPLLYFATTIYFANCLSIHKTSFYLLLENSTPNTAWQRESGRHLLIHWIDVYSFIGCFLVLVYFAIYQHCSSYCQSISV